jgi:hypothetical protein
MTSICTIRFSIRGAPRADLTKSDRPRSEWKVRLALPEPIGVVETEIRSWRYDSATDSTEYEFESEAL